MNYNIMCLTNDYGLTDDTKYYAKLFETKTHINGATHYNDCQIIFRAYHISSSSGLYSYKDFILTTFKDTDNNIEIINLVDLNPDTKGVEIVYTKTDDGVVTILGKGRFPGAKIKIQVLYSPTIGMFEFYNCSEFTNNIVDCISPVNRTRDIQKTTLNFLNNWIENVYLKSTYTVYDGICYVTFKASRGIIDNGTVIADNLPKPITRCYITCYDSNGNAGYLLVEKDGKLKVGKLLTSDYDIMCSFSYLIS